MYCDTSKVIINRVTKSTPGINAIVTKKHYRRRIQLSVTDPERFK